MFHIHLLSIDIQKKQKSTTSYYIQIYLYVAFFCEL